MRKRILALLLTVVLAVSMTNTIAFATETGGESGTPGVTATAAFTGGHAIAPTAVIPASLNAGGIITFSVGASNFKDAKFYDITKLSAVLTGPAATCFEKQAFWRDAVTGTIYFSLKAKSEAAYQAFTVYVTDGVNVTLSHSFSTAVSAPEASAPSSSSSMPESSAPSSSSSAPESSAPSSSSSAPESSVPSSSSSAPESSAPSGSSSAPESSAPSSSSAAPESSAPSSSSSAPESSASSSSNSTPESSAPSSSSSAPESSESSSSSSAPESSDTSDEDDDKDGGFLDTLQNFINAFNPPATTVTDTITGVNPAGSAWTHVSGLPSTSSPSTVANTGKIVFYIPDNNFATSGTVVGFGDNITALNTGKGSTFKVEVKNGSNDLTGYFDINFANVGSGSTQSYGVEMTVQNVPANGVLVPKGAVITFGGKNSYTFTADLNLVQAVSTGSTKATGITAGSVLGGNNTWISKNGSYYSGGINVLDDVHEGDEFLIHFYPQFFEWNDGKMPAKVTLSSIRSKISLRQSNSSNSKVFEAVELVSVKGEAVVRVKIKDIYPTVKAVDFKTSLYLTVGGKRHSDSVCDIEGTIGDDDPLEFYSEEKYIDISDGTVGQAAEGISKARVYIGEDVTLNVSYIRKNAKFYGVAVTSETSTYDQQVLEDYPDIDIVYTLYTLGLNGAGTTVTIDTYGGYYVYDKDLNYLGRTLKDLPYSDKYYLSVKELDIVEDDGWDDGDYYDDDDDDDYDFKDPPLSGDDLIPPANGNWNPATGRKA